MASRSMPQSCVGQTLHQVPTPSAVLDLAKLEVNCSRMLEAVHRLGLGWRAHIKTHKTVELTRLQVGDVDASPVHLVASTVLEVEKMVPLLREYQSKGREVNILYGFPLVPSAVDRLASASSALGPAALSVLVDHPDQLPHVAAIKRLSGNIPSLFIKVDMGYGRAGIAPKTSMCEHLISQVLAAETDGHCLFHGLYSHAGNSYEAREDWSALTYLARELEALRDVAALVTSRQRTHQPLTLSVGASPTAVSLQHPGLADATGAHQSGQLATVSALLCHLEAQGYDVEVHAGVYPVLDLQQLATHACDRTLLSASSIALTILCEVASLYPGRGPAGVGEALVNAGCLALGREPCADMRTDPATQRRPYSGWGIPMPWNGLDNPPPAEGFPAEHAGWQVGKVSQEHGILRWCGIQGQEASLACGQRVRIWPNHACIAGAGFDKYLVVDSRRTGKEDEVIEVWPRWRGW